MGSKMSIDETRLYRCVCCGCPVTDHAVDDEEMRECKNCECKQYIYNDPQSSQLVAQVTERKGI